MVMAPPFAPNSQGSHNYDLLCKAAEGRRPAGALGDSFAIAVLEHGKPLSRDSFLWFKIKPDFSVARLQEAYKARTNTDIFFRLANNVVQNNTAIRDLDFTGQQFFVLTAHEVVTRSTSTSTEGAPTTSSPARHRDTPLTGPVEKATRNSDDTFLNQNSFSINPEPQYEVNTQSQQVRNTPAHTRSVQGHFSPASPGSEPRYAGLPAQVNSSRTEEALRAEIGLFLVNAAPTISHQTTNLQKIISKHNPSDLEDAIIRSYSLLQDLSLRFAAAMETKHAKLFLEQINALRAKEMDPHTIIGVVGNAGSGKSSIINALLDEERLVPTSCMRACTSAVTEISWNQSDDENARYRAEIEFIQAHDWERELETSLAALINKNGPTSNECGDAEFEAGAAYARMQAVYPNKTKDMLAKCTVKELMDEPEVKALLSTIGRVEKPQAEPFYFALQDYIDGSENAMDSAIGIKPIEVWPLIKVVRVYTKADALSTGAVIVDLPGTQDSNAGRAAISAIYLKQCSAIWVVAPITRAVSDKTAHLMLGESFRQQLKYDGTYARVTVICSKIDDISLEEATANLSLHDEVSGKWTEADAVRDEILLSRASMEKFQQSMGTHLERVDFVEDEIETWEALQNDLANGKEVRAPSHSKKRKHSPVSPESHKKPKVSNSNGKSATKFNGGSASKSNSKTFGVEIPEALQFSEAADDHDFDEGRSLTMKEIEDKLAELKGIKKNLRRERSGFDDKIKALAAKILELEENEVTIKGAISMICIKGRSHYSKGTIQRQFAAGIKDLDIINAYEDDEDNHNPAIVVRDYEEIARSLPVFCCSSRAYQQISGRLQRDLAVHGFRSLEETGIPDLQEHCKRVADEARALSRRRFLTNTSQLLNSLVLWAMNDGTGLKMSDAIRGIEEQALQSKLNDLSATFFSALSKCSAEIKSELNDEIFQRFPDMSQQASAQAMSKVQKWGSPVNMGTPAEGGYCWPTYKALCYRKGVFSNDTGHHDLNAQLTEPLTRSLAQHWDNAFSTKLPQAVAKLASKLKALLSTFHSDVEIKYNQVEEFAPSFLVLGQQIQIYQALCTDLEAEMNTLVNHLQRESNRKFIPVVTNTLDPAYNFCAREVGVGQFRRMKNFMVNHVQAHLDMFDNSCNVVKLDLDRLCEEVSKKMKKKVNEMFDNLSRDYTEVILGGAPRDLELDLEEKLKAEILGLIVKFEQETGEKYQAAQQLNLGTTTRGFHS